MGAKGNILQVLDRSSLPSMMSTVIAKNFILRFAPLLVEHSWSNSKELQHWTKMMEEEVDIDRRSMPFANAGMMEPLNPCPKLDGNLLMVEAVPTIDCLEEDTEIFKPFNGVDNQNLCQLLRS